MSIFVKKLCVHFTVTDIFSSTLELEHEYKAWGEVVHVHGMLFSILRIRGKH